MTVLKSDKMRLASGEDVLFVRQTVRRWAIELGFSLVDQTKLITAASEIGRNTVIYGGGGTASVESLFENGRRGLRLTFEDQGPGIADVAQAMRDGFTTSGGLGLGLGGAKRLSNEFSIQSEPGKGTRISIARWR